MSRLKVRDPVPLAVVVSAFLGIRFVMFAGGLRFHANPLGQAHLLDLSALAADPFLAFTSNHIQPPLFNFFVGAVLRWSPFPDGISFQVVYLLMGLVTIVGLWALLRGLGARPWIAAAAATLVGWSPLMLRNESTLSYETLVTAYLVVSALACLRYLRKPTTTRLAAFALLLLAGALTRTTLQPLWLIGGLAIVLFARRTSVAWRPAISVAGVAVVILAAPSIHNALRFGTVGMSSYAGMNLDRITVMQLPQHTLDRMVADGELSEIAPIPAYAPYAAYAPHFPPCEASTGEPVLDDLKKSSGERNLNSVCYLPVYAQARRDEVAAFRAEPGIYLRSVATAALVYASWDVHSFDPNSWIWEDWRDVYAPVTLTVPVHVSFGGTDPQPYAEVLTKMINLNRFSVTVLAALVLCMAYGVRSLVRWRRNCAGDADWTRLYIAYTVVSVTVVSVMADSFENARFREPLDPLILGPLFVLSIELAVAGVSALKRRVVPPRSDAGRSGRDQLDHGGDTS